MLRKGADMKIKWFLPALAAALLAGCVTTDYGYRNDGFGDYYYGRPSGSYYGGVGYGYPGGVYGYGGYRYGSPSGYYGGVYSGYPYRYGYYGSYSYPYGRYGYSGYPYYQRPPVVILRPGHDHHHDRPDRGHGRDRDHDRKAPWRDLDTLRRNNATRPPSGLRMPAPQAQPGSVNVPRTAAPAWRTAPPAPRVQAPDRRPERQAPAVRQRSENRAVRMPERELRQRSEP